MYITEVLKLFSFTVFQNALIKEKAKALTLIAENKKLQYCFFAFLLL